MINFVFFFFFLIWNFISGICQQIFFEFTGLFLFLFLFLPHTIGGQGGLLNSTHLVIQVLNLLKIRQKCKAYGNPNVIFVTDRADS